MTLPQSIPGADPLTARANALAPSPNGAAVDALIARIARAKRAHTTRRIDFTRCAGLAHEGWRPRAGDLVLARVEVLGQHKHLQDANGRRVSLFAGDEIVVAYGNRYAPSQFEAYAPEDLGPCHLAAGGGLAARVVAANSRMHEPTTIQPLGVLLDESGAALRLDSAALAPRTLPALRPPVIAVLGTSMDSGKTTSAAALVRGFARAGLRVGAAKITGTGASGDPYLFRDSGAFAVLDFVDAGYPTTYLEAPETIEAISSTLIAHLAERGAEVVIVEVADGVLQRETRLLMESEYSRRAFDGVLFAASDALGAAGGVRWLASRGHRVLGATGILSSSPLARREAAEMCEAPVRGVEQLETPEVALEIRALLR